MTMAMTSHETGGDDDELAHGQMATTTMTFLGS